MSAHSSATPTSSASAADDYVIQLALDRGLIDARQVDVARGAVGDHTDLTAPAPRVLDLLIAHGALSARSVAELLAKEFGMQMAPDFANVRVTGDTLELVPRTAAVRHRLVPLSRDGHTLRVAIADPLETDGIDALGYMLKMTIEPVVATAAEISDAIDRFYGKDANSIDELLNDLSVGGADPSAAVTTEASTVANATDRKSVV